jgi:DNA-binding NarL/FixJ family response regulator
VRHTTERGGASGAGEGGGARRREVPLPPGSDADSPSLPAEETPGLTPRELDVLRAAAASMSNRGIARTLRISEHTVKVHLQAIFRKFRVGSRTEAVVYGIHAGYVVVDGSGSRTPD